MTRALVIWHIRYILGEQKSLRMPFNPLSLFVLAHFFKNNVKLIHPLQFSFPLYTTSHRETSIEELKPMPVKLFYPISTTETPLLKKEKEHVKGSSSIPLISFPTVRMRAHQDNWCLLSSIYIGEWDISLTPSYLVYFYVILVDFLSFSFLWNLTSLTQKCSFYGFLNIKITSNSQCKARGFGFFVCGFHFCVSYCTLDNPFFFLWIPNSLIQTYLIFWDF